MIRETGELTLSQHIKTKTKSNGRAHLEIFEFDKTEKRKKIMGRTHACTWTSNYLSSIPFFGWFYNKIQKLSSKGQAVLDMLQFEEPCNLIGRYRFKPLMRNQMRHKHAVFIQMSPIRVSNLTKKNQNETLFRIWEKTQKTSIFTIFGTFFKIFVFGHNSRRTFPNMRFSPEWAHYKAFTWHIKPE